MTNAASQPDDVDTALCAFATACPIPTASELDEWCARHPAFAASMRDYAEIARENFEIEAVDEDPRLDAIADRVFETGMWRVRAGRRTSLPELVKARGTTIPAIAAAIGIDRGILADIVAGRLVPPIGPRLVAALSAALGAARQAIREAVTESFDAPRVGYASSDLQEPVRPRTWAESVAASEMGADRKAHWIGED